MYNYSGSVHLYYVLIANNILTKFRVYRVVCTLCAFIYYKLILDCNLVIINTHAVNDT